MLHKRQRNMVATPSGLLAPRMPGSWDAGGIASPPRGVAPLAAPPSLEGRHQSPVLSVQCFGDFRAWRGHRRLWWASRRAKSLFKYLALNRRRYVAKDELMEVLWPECDPEEAAANLKAVVHSLRQALAADESREGDGPACPYVVFQNGTYSLSPDVEIWVDAEEFERLWTEGRRLEKEGKDDQATKAYEIAEALYEGDFMQDDPYEEWTLLRREGLKDVYLIILMKLARQKLNEGDYEACIALSQKILARDPCHEDAYRMIIESHARLGQRSRALYWYGACIKVLKETFDIPASDDTQALYAHLRASESIQAFGRT